MASFRNQICRYLLSILMIAGCAPGRAESAYYPFAPKPRVSIYKNIQYDAQGLPVFNNPLPERPSRVGDQFVLVQCIGNKPVKSFDIAVTANTADAARPFKVIYEWTGKGFRAGFASGKALVDSTLRDGQNQGTSDALRAVGPVILFSMGGFVVGLAASIPATFQELAKGLVESRETVIAYTVYEHDDRQRLARTKTYLPTDLEREIIKTDFYYLGDETKPFKTVIRSYPDDQERIIP